MSTMRSIDELRFSSSAHYQIIVKGSLDESWSERLNGMTIVNDESDGQPVTKLSGEVRDQAELIGVLCSIYEIHLPLISLEMTENRC